MKFCQQCGTENLDYAKFCQKCGAPLANLPEKDKALPPETPQKLQTAANYPDRKRQIIAGVVILAAAFIVCLSALVIYHDDQRKGYYSALTGANKYLEELEYDKAEASYLEAIKIDPKKEEPYLQLADLYLKQGKKEKASEILQQGQKATSSKRINKKLRKVDPQAAARAKTESSSESGGNYEEFMANTLSETGWADIGEFSDNEYNELGVVSAWRQDFDGDGSDELLTVTLEQHHTAEVRIALYKQDSGDVKLLDELMPKRTDTVNYGEEYRNIFLKKENGRWYLAINSMQTSQSYSSTVSNLNIYAIDDGFSQAESISESFYRGSFSIKSKDETILSFTDEEIAAFSAEQSQQEVNRALKQLKKVLSPYGLENHVSPPPEVGGTRVDIELLGYDENDTTETDLAMISRSQTGEYDEDGGEPEMSVKIKDFTDARERFAEENASDGDTADNEDGTDSEIRFTDIVNCLGMTREEIEETYGELDDEPYTTQDGGDYYAFSSSDGSTTVCFPAVFNGEGSTGIVSTADGVFTGIDSDGVSLKEFEHQMGVELESSSEEWDYYGETSDGTAIYLTLTDSDKLLPGDTVFLKHVD